MQVSTSSRSLFRQLNEHQDQYLPTQTLKDITRLITQIKALIRWLDHASFTAQHYKELRSNLLKICLEIATSSQRDRFMEHPVDHVR
jgi:Connector enhancer of kinase suppressor of ras